MRMPLFKHYLAVVAIITISLPAISNAGPSCKCRYAGKTFEVNTCVCLNVAAGAQMACCDMVVNNTSWTFSQRACPMSSIPLSDTPDQSLAELSVIKTEPQPSSPHLSTQNRTAHQSTDR